MTAAVSKTPAILSNARLTPPITTMDQVFIRNNPCRAGSVITINNVPNGTVATIYSVSGRRMIELPPSAGIISWDVTLANGKAVGPGVYLCHLRSASATAVVKIMVRP